MTGYIAIEASIVGNPEDGYDTAYSSDLEVFPTRAKAIRHGFTLGRSDDFNIGRVVDGKLTEFWWMDKQFQGEDLENISYHLCLPEAMGEPEVSP